MTRSICICGGGSLGHACAGVFTSYGYRVSILTGHPEKWTRDIFVTDPDGRIFSGNIYAVSSDSAELIPESNLILLCLPGYLIENWLLKIKPYLSPGTIVGSIVSNTGFFFLAHRILPKESGLFGFQRVPFIARVNEYGKSAKLLGYKELLKIAIENVSDKTDLMDSLSEVLMTPVTLLNNFYEASLTNSNPILHTGRLFTLWEDPRTHAPVQDCIKFYADWTDSASEILLKMDYEFGLLLTKLGINRSVVPTLLEYYECVDAHALTDKMKSIQAFQTIDAPMKKTSDGWIPDFDSRYFTEDFPFGLKFIKELANSNNIPTPTIDKVYAWGMSVI